MGSESSWVGRKAVKRIGGMSDALSIAADLGFSISPSPSSSSSNVLLYSLFFLLQSIIYFTNPLLTFFFFLKEAFHNSSPTTAEKGEDLIRVLKELTSVQRKIADLQVELQGRKVCYVIFIVWIGYELPHHFLFYYNFTLLAHHNKSCT